MPRKKKRNRTKKKAENLKLEAAGILLLGLAFLSFVSFSGQTGVFGRFLVRFLEVLAGSRGAYLVAGACGLLGIGLCAHAKKITAAPRLVGLCVLLLASLAGVHLYLTPRAAFSLRALWESGLRGEGGGILGALGGVFLSFFFGRAGAPVVLAALGSLGLVLLTGLPLKRLLGPLASALAAGARRAKEKVESFIFVTEEEEAPAPPPPPVIIDTAAPAARKEEPAREEQPKEPPDPGFAPAPTPAEPARYTFPPLDLLRRPPRPRSGRANKEILESARLLEETLENFGVRATVSQVSRGPAITRYEIQPAPGVKVSKIVRLADDIALSLAAPDVRIEAPIPGKAALGIEVPNKEVTPVYLREILESAEFQEASSKLTVALGKDIAGQPVVADLTKLPHLLIAGATGSGKSVCLNAIICSILFKARPDEVKFLLIDPKVVELISYNGIPHLIAPVVTEPKRAASALRWLVSEMESRYELFARLGVRDIARYNTLCGEGSPYQPLPFIVVVIDELADLMMIAPVEVEDAICRLAQMARAAGIHLVVATQRPSVDVITGVIKANIPSRIAFAVSSQIDSRTILDLNGAEKLLGRGDMLFLPVGAMKPLRVQGALVTEGEVEEVVSFIKKQGEPAYVSEFPELPTESAAPSDPGDPLFFEAAKVVIEAGHASASLLQRRLRVGYARAARLIDLLEEKGIVGPFEGAKPRAILMTLEQLYRYYGK